jgi:hypothetical protein
MCVSTPRALATAVTMESGLRPVVDGVTTAIGPIEVVEILTRHARGSIAGVRQTISPCIPLPAAVAEANGKEFLLRRSKS